MQQLVEQLKALADESRLKILSALKEVGQCSCVEVDPNEPGLCVCDMEEMLGLTQSTVSHHLEILRRADLVTCEKKGQWLYCRRNEGALASLAAALGSEV